MNLEKLKKEYDDNFVEFVKVSKDVHSTLNRIVRMFYDQFKFSAYVQEPRIKTIDSIIKKMNKKGVDSDSLFMADAEKLSVVVNDFIGARIICNTTDDVKEIHKQILDNKRFKLEKEQSIEKASGYRAMHLDLLYEVHFNDRLVSFPIEIQIKTQLQHAWAEITHDESYKPVVNEWSNEWEAEYSKHMADILNSLDDMAKTIRKQRVTKVLPPSTIDENITIINSETLSFKISKNNNGYQLTKQEIGLVLNRLKEQNVFTLAELDILFNDSEIRKSIQEYKRKLQININVTPYDILYYGSVFRKNGAVVFDEMRTQYGYVDVVCLECKKPLKREEYEFMETNTDADGEYFCKEHSALIYNHICGKCGLHSKQPICKNCEVSEGIEF